MRLICSPVFEPLPPVPSPFPRLLFPGNLGNLTLAPGRRGLPRAWASQQPTVYDLSISSVLVDLVGVADSLSDTLSLPRGRSIDRIMASTFGATTTCSLTAAPTSFATNKKISLVSRPSTPVPHSACLQRRCNVRVNAAKELHVNKDGLAIKKSQTGVNKLADLIGVTLGPKGCNVVLESKYGSPKMLMMVLLWQKRWFGGRSGRRQWTRARRGVEVQNGHVSLSKAMWLKRENREDKDCGKASWCM